MTEKMNLALGINFDLLKTNLSATYEKSGEGSKILLLPTKVTSPNSVTLGEMVAEFKSAFGMEDAEKNIKGNLESIQNANSPIKWENITFQLQAAFFYKEMPAAGTPKPGQNPSGEGSEGNAGTTEYAFAIGVNMADALPNLGFIRLNSLFIALWNTERSSVLEQMGTGNISRMLQQLDA